jgi:proteic killer suppression protein
MVRSFCSPGPVLVNYQWRICFCWKDGDAFDVEIVDYH